MIKLREKLNKGFSLVETFVAISLLLLVIVGPMTISARTAKSSSFASEQIQAFFLAQEGLELAEKARDDLALDEFLNNFGSSDGWNTFTDNSSVGTFVSCFTAGCGLEWDGSVVDNIKVVSCNPLANCRLYLRDVNDSERSWYTYSNLGGSKQSLFTRKITFQEVTGGSGREIKVISEVTWRTGSLIDQQKVTLDTYLFNKNYAN